MDVSELVVFMIVQNVRPDGPQWPKHVVVSIINRIQDSCVLTYPTPSLIAYNTAVVMHLKMGTPWHTRIISYVTCSNKHSAAEITSLNNLRRGRLRLKCDGTRAETRFRFLAKRTSPFKSAGGRQFSRLLAAEVCASAVVMLDIPCSGVV